MLKRKPFHPEPNEWEYFPELTIGSRTLWPGDHVKLRGTRGKTYQFQTLLTNTKTDKQWAVVKGPITMHGAGFERPVDIDKLVLIPKRRKKKS